MTYQVHQGDTFYGPFLSEREASDWARLYLSGSDWFVVPQVIQGAK